ncbi:ABC transporter permease [Nodularia spumigena CS-584]|uniref:Lipopolysaccharide transport system permease protein n=1 Tax=Nodularia spumigena UHCC 0039 TaxID=1914872 RepID=A0A2S0QB62_NODSP|nr:ABC transporter permease [Nodularia spumigena]AHJ28664.1 O-antigen export system, permease protein [Nodularia spumigena CCY9414]AVZ31607.1 lipopolysaccharide transport system permease protein [Nodularia spumigena UHCC 0039]MDB9381727.1 ABC transporter permease [Nodularia spumigena CS-584]
MRKPNTISNRVVYTSESRIRHPLQLFKEMGRDLLASRELAWRLLVRDISAQYRQSLFGVLWAFLPPIITAAGLLVARNAGAVNIGDTEIPYPAYVMFSMALWQTFVESLSGPIAAVNTAKPMLAKINFPKEAIILAKLGEVFFNFGIKLILILGLFIWFQIPVNWSILLAPVALIHLVILGTGIGLLLAPVGALYGDIAKAIPLIVSPWLLLTPVIYPTPKEGLFATIVNLNPVTPLLVTTRDLATSGLVTNPAGFWVVSGLAFGVLLIAWVWYRLAIPFVVERMSS